MKVFKKKRFGTTGQHVSRNKFPATTSVKARYKTGSVVSGSFIKSNRNRREREKETERDIAEIDREAILVYLRKINREKVGNRGIQSGLFRVSNASRGNRIQKERKKLGREKYR